MSLGGLERTKKLEDILRNLEAPIIRLDSKMAKLCQQVEGIQKPLYGRFERALY